MYYKEINHKISNQVLNDFLELAKNPNGYDMVTTKYSRVKMLDKNLPIMDNDPFIKMIKENYTNFLYMIFKSPPNYHINYHTDKRHFGLNIPLTSPASIYFGECEEEYFNTATGNKKLPSFWNIQKLDYKLGVPYVCDTHVHHSTINLSESDRYMLTFTFMNVTMDQFLHDIESKLGYTFVP